MKWIAGRVEKRIKRECCSLQSAVKSLNSVMMSFDNAENIKNLFDEGLENGESIKNRHN